MSKDVNARTAGNANEINHDDGYGYCEDEIYEQICCSCDKTFSYTTSIHFYYSAEKAPCLNHGGHT